MKKSYLMLAAAAALFAACSNDDGVAEAQKAEQQVAAGEVPVGFDAYVNRATTRSGDGGVMTVDGTGSTNSLQTTGFGVFAYYCDGKPYSETSIPDFMYNEKVSTSSWTYSPVKYWPNEFGSTAISDNEDRLTFFAYAPWVDVTAATGRVKGSEESGIVGLTSNTAMGDPYVKYYVDFTPSKSVDLLWGVAATATKPAAVTGATNTITAGEPYIDVFKPGANGDDTKIKFDFNHALAKLNVQIDAYVDDVTGTTTTFPAQTKIWVRSITFEGIAEKGKFNLRSPKTDPQWYELSSANTKIGSGSVTIYDGRRDGKEGQENAVATNESTLGLNSKLIQAAPYAISTPYTTLEIDDSHTGVPAGASNAINLFESTTNTDPVFVIPTGEDFKVTIVYDVETSDEKLSKYLSDGAVKGSTIENTITKEITFTGDSNAKVLKAGKAYTLKLHLGMTSVKFDAVVTPWDEVSGENVDLPINGPVAPAP